MNIILWVIIGFSTGVYTATTAQGVTVKEAIVVALLGSFIGGLISALVLDYSINGLNPASILLSLVFSAGTVKYFKQLMENKKYN